MNLRPLLIDDSLRKQIQTLLAYASSHHYLPNQTTIPGDIPQHTITTDHGYRIVFSYTQLPDDTLYRDISISVKSKGRWPAIYPAYVLAQLFGFTGWDGKTLDPPPSSWLIAKDINNDAIRFAQLITPEEQQPCPPSSPPVPPTASPSPSSPTPPSSPSASPASSSP